jgi:uncharacterized repeat protein (TIGR02543 family)
MDPSRKGYLFQGWIDENGKAFDAGTVVVRNTTVKAQWVRVWTVTFDANGGSWSGQTADITRTVIGGEALGADMPADPTRAGYTFIGWKDGSGNPFGWATKVTGSTTVYAQWADSSTQTWTVTFDANGGNWSGSMAIITKAAVNGAPLGTNIAMDPVRDGYEFAGWKDSAGNMFGADTKVTSNIAVKAQWLRVWTVTFDANGGAWQDGSASIAKNIANGASLGSEMPADPARSGYIFAGWKDDNAGVFSAATRVSGDITVKAQWTRIWTVTFDADGGNWSGQTDNITRAAIGGTSLGADIPADPVRSGYTFIGWKDGAGSPFGWATKVTGDITVYAQWADANTRTCIVTFDADGGNWSGQTGNVTKAAVSGSALGTNMPLDPARNGYVFQGWNDTNGNVFDSSTKVVRNITVKAKWARIWTVTFDADGGGWNGSTADVTRSAIGGASLGAGMPADPTRAGYTFIGWKDGSGNQFGWATKVTGNMTVYAQWADSNTQTYIVTFDANGGSWPGKTGTVTKAAVAGTALGAHIAMDPERENYGFTGWKDAAGNPFSSATKVVSNITVKAQWSINKYVVTFDPNGGGWPGLTAALDKAVSVNTSFDQDMPLNPHRNGWTFAGWYENKNGTGSEFTDATIVVGNMTVYAKWLSGIDTDGDGQPDINIDTNGDGKPDLNIDTNGDFIPDLNVDTNGDGQADLNVDTDGDGLADLNVETTGDGNPDVNVDTNGDGHPDSHVDANGEGNPISLIDPDGDGKPNTNLDLDGNGKPDLNIDTNGDGKPDLNIDTNGDGIPDLNVDTNGDGKPDVNIDTDGDGFPDQNVDPNGPGKPISLIDPDGDGKPNVNIDTNGDGKPDLNIDTNGDGKPDVNIDTNGDGRPDLNVDTNGDGKPDINIDTDGDGKADLNIDSDGDGKPDKNFDRNGNLIQDGLLYVTAGKGGSALVLNGTLYNNQAGCYIVDFDAKVRVIAKPQTGYKFHAWTSSVGFGGIGAADTTFTMPKLDNVTVRASFVEGLITTPPPAVKAQVKSFGVTQKTIYVKRGKKVKLPLIAYTTAAGKQVVTWKASKNKVATVKKGKKIGTINLSGNKNAKLTIRAGKKLGTSKITLTAANGKKLVIKVKVVKQLKKVAASSVKIGKLSKKKALRLKVGQVKKLTAKFTKKATAIATWKSSKPKVVKIDAAGRITVLKKGTAKITLKVGGKKKTLKVRVR